MAEALAAMGDVMVTDKVAVLTFNLEETLGQQTKTICTGSIGKDPSAETGNATSPVGSSWTVANTSVSAAAGAAGNATGEGATGQNAIRLAQDAEMVGGPS